MRPKQAFFTPCNGKGEGHTDHFTLIESADDKTAIHTHGMKKTGRYTVTWVEIPDRDFQVYKFFEIIHIVQNTIFERGRVHLPSGSASRRPIRAVRMPILSVITAIKCKSCEDE